MTYMDTEKLAEEIMTFIEDKAEELRGIDNDYAVLNIGEVDKLSDICDEIANIVWNAVKRNLNSTKRV